MPGARPDRSGPVCSVTAWRARTRRVGFGCSRSGWGSGCGSAVTPVNSTDAPPNLLPVTDQPIPLSTHGVPETVLEPEPADAVSRLAEALSLPDPARRDAVAAVVAQWPRFLDGWARLGQLARDPV